MKVTFLGTGTSQGVPVIACECEVCLSSNRKDKRLRSSVLIEVDDLHIVIDTGPDFRQQMLTNKVQMVDTILYTHEHRDHTSGLDDIRSYNHKYNIDMPIYAQKRVIGQLEQEYHYIFSGHKYPGIPRVITHEISNQDFYIKKTKIIPILVHHYKLPILGFRIGDFTYITDAKTIDGSEIEKIKGTKVLVINALQKEAHISHFTLEEAVSFAKKINAEVTYFTHISHKLGTHENVSKDLEKGIELAYDSLVIEID